MINICCVIYKVI